MVGGQCSTHNYPAGAALPRGGVLIKDNATVSSGQNNQGGAAVSAPASLGMEDAAIWDLRSKIIIIKNYFLVMSIEEEGLWYYVISWDSGSMGGGRACLMLGIIILLDKLRYYPSTSNSSMAQRTRPTLVPLPNDYFWRVNQHRK